jgi:hypothetical protein
VKWAQYILVALLLVGTGAWVKRKFDRVPISQRIKMADIKEGGSRTTIQWPKGGAFHFVIGSSLTNTWDAAYSGGVIRISSGTQLVSQFYFSPATTMDCNWLDKHQLRGVILNWATNWYLTKLLSPTETYEVILTISNPPPVDCSLWLTYVQSSKDFRAGKYSAVQNIRP